jgi:hypothetical protein
MLEYSNWAVLTVSFVVVVSLALSGVALCSVLHLASSKWRFEVRSLASSLTALFPLAFVLLIILLVGAEHTFPWLGHGSSGHDAHMPGWYHPSWIIVRQIAGLIFMWALYAEFVKRQAVSERSPEDAASFHNIATWIPFLFVLYSSMVAWDFEMTLVPGWHSAIYGMQQFISNFGMFLAFLVIWISVLNSRSKLVKPVPEYVYNYLAQMMLAFTLLFIYTYYSQYLTIWYGNFPEETGRVMEMQDGAYSCIWWSVLVLKFIIPFVTFCFPKPRHNIMAINVVAVSIIVGTLLERFVWIGGASGDGSYPIVAAIVVGGIVAGIGYFLVRSRMHSTQLIKG